MNDFIQEFKDSDEDFIAIHYQNPMDANKEHLSRLLIQNRAKPKQKFFSSEDEKVHYYWPGYAPSGILKLIKSFSKGQRYSDCFHCVYRIRHSEGLEGKIKELIPEQNRESV